MNPDAEVERTLLAIREKIADRRRRRVAIAAEFPAFRAAIEERLRSIEREVAEAKQRINALLLMAAGTVVSAVAVRLAEFLR